MIETTKSTAILGAKTLCHLSDRSEAEEVEGPAFIFVLRPPPKNAPCPIHSQFHREWLGNLEPRQHPTGETRPPWRASAVCPTAGGCIQLRSLGAHYLWMPELQKKEKKRELPPPLPPFPRTILKTEELDKKSAKT